MLRVTKTYGHDLGLSACFRQWRADSHCRYLHGYALSFTFVFEANSLDKNGWVMDFGGLKKLKQWLVKTFDHRVCVAADDPLIALAHEMTVKGMANMQLFENGVGCEAFAKLAFEEASGIVVAETNGRVRVISCECREHGSNSATYISNGQ